LSSGTFRELRFVQPQHLASVPVDLSRGGQQLGHIVAVVGPVGLLVVAVPAHVQLLLRMLDELLERLFDVHVVVCTLRTTWHADLTRDPASPLLGLGVELVRGDIRRCPRALIRSRSHATSWHAGEVLSHAEIEAFVVDGFVPVRGAVPADVLDACRAEIWSALGDRGVTADDPSTWREPVVRIACPETEAFAAAGTQPVLWEAFDQLIGEGLWWRRRGVGGTIPVRFPSRANPGDAGWHIEGSFDKGGQSWVNYRSRARGLLALYLFSDVDADSAPTRVRPGSHLDAARVLRPAGYDGLPFSEAAPLAAQASKGRPTALVTGQAGDVFLCHPFLVHAASWPHTGRQPRIIAQPGVALHNEFPLVPLLSPVERAIAAGLDM
jgi:hypothetical protein